MFKRIRETKRVLSYRLVKTSPSETPDILIVAVTGVSLNKTSRSVAKLMESALFVVLMGIGAKLIGQGVSHITQQKVVSLVTVVGLLGSLLGYVGHATLQQFRKKLQEHFKVSERLAPYVGHKLHSTLRILKGVTRSA